MDESIKDNTQDHTTVKEGQNEKYDDKENIAIVSPESNNTPKVRKSVKRKRQEDNETPLYFLTQVFLKAVYPLSSHLTKSITVGIFKSLEYKPAVVITHNDKNLMLSQDSWNSLKNYIDLIDCYLRNKVFGRKTSVRLASSDIEMDIIKSRGNQCVRIRDLTKHDVKVQLTLEEFHMLAGVAPSIERYIQQMISFEPIVKDYLLDAIENASESPLIYGPVDSSIYNRLPQEVHLYRHMKSFTMEPIFQDLSNTLPCCEDEVTDKETSKMENLSDGEVE